MAAIDFLGKVWPEWQVESKPIGQGSYGVVYKAFRKDHEVESTAAIKVISIPQNESEIESLRFEGLSLDETKAYLQGVVSDFVSEIQLMESFKGVQNIVSVEDYKVVEKEGEIGWDIYIRMELLTPFTTYSYDKMLSEKEIMKLGIDICTALELCKKRNVIHRDIKPENIFINQFGDFKLGDFGIARKLENITSGLSQKGTYSYMAPEIEKGLEYDDTVDLYSLGVVLYRLMNNNRLPFIETEKQLLSPSEREAANRRRLDGEPLPPPCNASPDMAAVILCACEPDPTRRFASATAMKHALMNVAGGIYNPEEELEKTTAVRRPQKQQDLDATVSVRKAPETQQPASPVNTFGAKKSKTPLILSAVLLAVLILGGLFAFWYFSNGKDHDGGLGDESSAISSQPEESEDELIGVYSDSEQEVISDFLDAYTVYRSWIDGRTGTAQTAIDQIDTVTQMHVHNGETMAELLGTFFSDRYVASCMLRLGVSKEDDPLLLPLSSAPSVDLTLFEPDYQIDMAEANTCFLTVHWKEGSTENTYVLYGEKKDRRWIFDDYTEYLEEGQYGLFGSSFDDGLEGSTDDPPANTTVVSLKYVDNVPDSVELYSTPEEGSDNILSTLLLGTKVGFIENADDVFAYVEYSGMYGYVKQAFLSSVMPNTTVASYQYITNVPVSAYLRSSPEEREDNILGTVAVNTEVGFIENTNSIFAKVKYNDLFGYVKREFLSASPPNTTVVSYRYIFNVPTAAYLRSTPEELDNNILDTIYLGTEVGFIENANSIFAKVKYGSKIGYVKQEFLSSVPPYSAGSSYQYITNVPVAAYLRSSPEERSDNILDTLALGTEVEFIENADSIFARVRYGTTYGYVKREFLSSVRP